MERLALLAVDLCAQYVCRQQVRRKLNTTEVSLDKVSQRLDSQGLGQTRNTFQQDVSVAQETYQQALYQMLLADNNLIHTHCQGIYKGTLTLDALLEFTNINRIAHCCIKIV